MSYEHRESNFKKYNYRGRGERSRSPLRQQTTVTLSEVAMDKLKEQNLFEMGAEFPDVGIRINETELTITFRGPNYKKKEVMKEIFQRLKEHNILMPR